MVLLSALFLGVPLTRKIVLVLLVSYAGVLLSVVGNLRSGLHATATIVTIYATGIACIACVLQFVCLRPLSALRLPWQVHALFLREPLNLLQLAGAALVILSVMYLTDRKRAIVPS